MASLDELTSADAVRRAMALFDELGRDAFLERHGYGRAHRFWLVEEGGRYDSKAIAGVAWGFQHAGGRRALAHTAFSGGEATVKRKLEALGFTVVEDPAPVGSGRSDHTRRTWLFQANPKHFDIDGYFATNPADFLWLARQRADEMDVGDAVFLWRAVGGGDRALSGVVAEAEIAKAPAVQPEDAAARFWVRGGGGGDPAVPQRRVRLRLLRAAGNGGIVRRDAALDDPVLSGMTVLTARTGTNFLLRPEQAERLAALWAGTGTAAAPLKPGEADDAPFDPTGVVDAREAVARQIEARRGQQAFRDALLAAYNGRCAVTGCPVVAVLEAAHIHPYRGAETNHIANGLLLRADLHTLLDCGLMAIDPDDFKFFVAPSIRGSSYGKLHGRALRPRGAGWPEPSAEALRLRFEEFTARHGS